MSGTTTKSLVERLAGKEVVVAAEGYLMELERRGFNRHGSFVPMVVLDHPEVVEQLTREFVHAGSDMCQAFTYYAHRQKMKDMKRESEFETLNRKAHEIAKTVARETGTLFCSGFGTTNLYDPNDPEAIKLCEQLYREQISLSAEFEVDYICLETLWDYGEASIALKVAKDYNIPVVITLAPLDISDGELKTFDGYTMVDALKRLQAEGAACVGVNCARGPETIIPIVRELRKEITGPLACVSLGYRTTTKQPTWYMLENPQTGERSFPEDLGAHFLGVSEVEWYAKELKSIGVDYVGFCCGNCSSYTRALAMGIGRQPPAAKYVSDYKAKSTLSGNDTYSTSRYNTELPKFMGMTK